MLNFQVREATEERTDQRWNTCTGEGVEQVGDSEMLFLRSLNGQPDFKWKDNKPCLLRREQQVLDKHGGSETVENAVYHYKIHLWET